MSFKPINRPVATIAQRENFKVTFATIISNNNALKDQYSIQFFETALKSNYAFTGRDGKSLNILPLLTLEESEQYLLLKSNWQR